MIHARSAHPCGNWQRVLEPIEAAFAASYLVLRFLKVGRDLPSLHALNLFLAGAVVLLPTLYLISTLLCLRHASAAGAWIKGHRLRSLLALSLIALLGWNAGNFAIQGAVLSRGAAWHLLAPVAILVAFVQIGLWAQRLPYSQTRGRIVTARIEPARELIISFLLLITLGTLALMAPAATVEGTRISPLDLLFTATSATCVTGLTVVDTHAAFTPFGQTIILVLMQTGGLGLMSFIAALSVLGGGEVGVRDRFVLGSVLSSETSGSVLHVLLQVLLLTFAVEAIGALALYLPLQQVSPQPAFDAVFHAVSAFCNAGFSTLPGGVVDVIGGSAWPIVLLLLLFIVGGIGFGVISELGRRAIKPQPHRPFRLHTRVALRTTLFLLLAGTLITWMVERSQGLAMLPLAQQWRAALFHAASTRTAGFAYLPLGTFSDATLFLFCLLMFIGASPGGTGGGVKTTTFALHVASLWSTLLRRPRVEMLRRTVPADLVARAAAVVLAAAALVAASVFLLSWIERDIPFLDLLFEVTSAVSTTGLSTGVTTHLQPIARIILIADMFLGRVGPLSLFLILGRGQRSSARRTYANESLLVG
jgi:trk system potassium uptake protein TrkH